LAYYWLCNEQHTTLHVMCVPIQHQSNSIHQFVTSDCLTSEIKCGDLLTTERSVFVLSVPPSPVHCYVARSKTTKICVLLTLYLRDSCDSIPHEFNFVNYVFLLLCWFILIVMYSYYIYIFLVTMLRIIIIIFMYSYCYVYIFLLLLILIMFIYFYYVMYYHCYVYVFFLCYIFFLCLCIFIVMYYYVYILLLLCYVFLLSCLCIFIVMYVPF
jgi:hypothetical protein